MLLASSKLNPEMLVNILQYRGHPPTPATKIHLLQNVNSVKC